MIIFKILAFCTLISFTNLLGMHPQKDDMSKWLEDKHWSIKTLVYTYVTIVLIGWVHLAWAIFYFGFYL